MSSLTLNGVYKLDNDVAVEGVLRVSGALSARELKAEKLIVSGVVKARNVQAGEAVVNGILQAQSMAVDDMYVVGRVRVSRLTAGNVRIIGSFLIDGFKGGLFEARMTDYSRAWILDARRVEIRSAMPSISGVGRARGALGEVRAENLYAEYVIIDNIYAAHVRLGPAVRVSGRLEYSDGLELDQYVMLDREPVKTGRRPKAS